jgi:molecular chaperone Hsp33
MARMLFVDATQTLDTLVELHEVSGGAVPIAVELGVASLLMSAWTKGDERIMLQLQAERPRANFTGETDAEGHFRGFLRPGRLPPVSRVKGLLLAIKSDGAKEMYRGITAVDDEPVLTALDRHLSQSDQVDVVLRAGTLRDGRHVGLLVERLPGAGVHFDAAAELLRGGTLEQLVSEIVEDGTLLSRGVDELERRPIAWKCRCSVERVASMILGLGAQEIQAMIDEDGGAEVRCHFCNSLYQFDRLRLEEMVQALRA